MMQRISLFVLLLFLIEPGPSALGQAVDLIAEPDNSLSAPTPLDDYVARKDSSFAWEIVTHRNQPMHDEIVVELTSQKWRNESEIDRVEWKHWLTVIAPKVAPTDVAMLYVTGGSNRDDPPKAADGRLIKLALATGSVVAELRNVPNQPLVLSNSGEGDNQKERYEDDLLAASWVESMKSGDPTWIAQLAMAKSAVAAMDAVQQVLAADQDLPQVERFVVAGASKRGWTTWLAGAVDPRVVAIAPIVIDVLNIAPSIKHHYASYGFWSKALKDYENQGLAERMDDPESEAIRAIIDPYRYRDRLTMPKCLINASGDEFFLPDSSRFYFDDLVGEKHLSYTPNVGHSLRGSNALDTLVSFHASVVHNLKRPKVTWTNPHGAAEHVVTCSHPPIEATLWRAVNPKARDFRHPIVGDAFKSQELKPQPDGSYLVKVEKPEEGFSATFARFTFDIGAPKPWRVSTPVWVAPDVEPFANE